jgi:hypothetical protein
MTQPYGQQPNQGGYPQSGGYPQTPGQGQPQQGYPQSPPYGQPAQSPPHGQPAQGYPQAPSFGSMPNAPQEYSSGPIPRPGSATAAAVLAFVQAGVTAVPGVLALLGSSSLGGNAEGWASTIAILIGVALLIAGGVQLMGGKGRTMLVVACGLELLISLYFIIRFAALDTGGSSDVSYGVGLIIGFAVFYAIMPVVALVLTLGATTTQFLESRRGH